MLTACIRWDFVKTLGVFFPFMLISGKIKLSIRLAGTAPGNTRGLNETLCSRVFPTGGMVDSPPPAENLLISPPPGKIPFSPLQTHLSKNFHVITQKQLHF